MTYIFCMATSTKEHSQVTAALFPVKGELPREVKGDYYEAYITVSKPPTASTGTFFFNMNTDFNTDFNMTIILGRRTSE